MNLKKFSSWIVFALLTLPLFGCSSQHEKTTVLRVLNLEDYIYIDEEDSANDLVHLFENYINEDEEKYSKYGKVEVVYETTDTNETLYNELLTGKAKYDLICTSDYMLQKLIVDDLIQPLKWDEETSTLKDIDNYSLYASKYIKNRLEDISAVPSKGLYKDKVMSMSRYSVGYMWGTLGIIFNPEYSGFNNIDSYDVVSDMSDWGALWDSKYQNSISIKDSVRDTYAVGILKTYADELNSNLNEYKSGNIDLVTYQHRFSEIFNRCEQENIDDVYEELLSLKQNVFGLEVDSGKQDIVTGKVGVNIAWSGDAVYSIELAEEFDINLLYSIPDIGANIWFDGWAIPNSIKPDSLNFDLAHEFLNFISDPENAALNIDYTGYTSFIGGDDIFDLNRSYYDVRYEEIYDENDNPIIAIKDSDIFELTYDDCLNSTHDSMKNDYGLFTLKEDEEQSYEPILNEDGNQKTYGDLLIIDEDNPDYEVVDLSYFFTGTLEEYEDMVIYTDEYFVPVNEEGELSSSVGGSFFCAFPDETTMNRCAIMKDFGEKQNRLVMQMWEKFKSDSLPNVAFIILFVEVGLFFLFGSKIMYDLIFKRMLRNRRIQHSKKK